ncbi:iron-containing alcohol dehydrogenase [Bacteroides neonati]|uniref:iron-containing alcohol dehydrogenase n=1 Tax=Bacteroides neonati TaxID=1347393 RepID=UPI0004BCB702|nr:iron-containing alcohol dehydrogenase [Bacteroides neonati]
MSKLYVTAETYHGIGSLEELKKIKGKKAIVVCGKGSVQRNGVLDRALSYLKEAGIESTVFAGVEDDPSVDTVMKGAEEFKAFQPDWVIGLGGCSCIDAAKMMWVFYEYPELTFAEAAVPFSIPALRDKARFVAIPTTSGTGTEMTGLAVITDREKGVKYPVVSYELTPDIAIIDGDLCKTMPKSVTAHTGLDALTHCIEAYVSNIDDNYADALAKGGMELIFDNLENVVMNPTDLVARQNMHDASAMGGFAFTNSWLGIAHSLAHQLGGMYHIPHGCANAIVLPNVIRFNSKVTNRYNKLAEACGLNTAEEFAQKIESLRFNIGVIDSVSAYGVDKATWEKNLDYIATNALADPCTGFNPRQPSKEELAQLFQACYDGAKIAI